MLKRMVCLAALCAALVFPQVAAVAGGTEPVGPCQQALQGQWRGSGMMQQYNSPFSTSMRVEGDKAYFEWSNAQGSNKWESSYELLPNGDIKVGYHGGTRLFKCRSGSDGPAFTSEYTTSQGSPIDLKIVKQP